MLKYLKSHKVNKISHGKPGQPCHNLGLVFQKILKNYMSRIDPRIEDNWTDVNKVLTTPYTFLIVL